MLTTPEHLCQYLAGCIRIYRQAMPKLLHYIVHVPYEYIKDTECFLSDHTEFRRRVEENISKVIGTDNSIMFDIGKDGGLTATVGHPDSALITSWPFTASTYLIDKLIVFHRETVGSRVIVRISQDNLLGSENIMEAFRTFRGRFGDDLEFRINKDHFEARTF